MSIKRWWFALMIALMTGCASNAAPIATRAPTQTRGIVATTESKQRVELAIFGEQGAGAITTSIASAVTIRIAFRPMKQVVESWNDDATNRYETEWKNPSIAEMRYCVGVGQTCALPNEWKPFATEARVSVSVSWVGARDYGVTAQFRDANGKIIPAGNNATASANTWMVITGVVDDKTPIALHAPAIQTIIANARAAFPVSGKIQVGGQPVVGRTAGSVFDITVRFEATSARAPVNEMRVKTSPLGRCLTPEEMSDAAWEKFVAEKTFSYRVPINWSTFKAHAQYRDAQGNLSPVYCGEIVIEGMP